MVRRPVPRASTPLQLPMPKLTQAVDPHNYPVVKRGTAQRREPLGRPAGRCLHHTHLGIATSLSCGPVASPHSVSAARRTSIPAGFFFARLGSSTMATTQDPTPAGVTHYAPRSVLEPGDRPLCGNKAAVYSDDPGQVAGCEDCLELPAEDLDEDNEHWAHCLHCQQEISAQGGVEWRRVVREPCPYCGRADW